MAGETGTASRAASGGEYYLISYVARAYGVHPQTLRLYEKVGLLTPERSEGNTRIYSRRDLGRLETILGLTREMGVNLAGVEVILRLREQLERLRRDMDVLRRRSGKPGAPRRKARPRSR